MNAVLVRQVMKIVLPAAAGALGTMLATANPAVYASLCGG